MQYARLNRIYKNIKQRCYNPKILSYKDYGAKGVSVCDEWNNTERVGKSTKGWLAFKKWALENGYQEHLSIDRINNTKGYSPENCRWVTQKEQQNNKSNSHLITYKGKTKTLAQWCDELELNYRRTQIRLNTYHWSVKRAFEIKYDTRLKMVTYKDRTQSLIEWCRELNLDYVKTWKRINKCKWAVERAFNES